MVSSACSDIDAQCIRCEKDDAGVPVCRECNSNGFYYSKENAECRSKYPNVWLHHSLLALAKTGEEDRHLLRVNLIRKDTLDHL